MSEDKSNISLYVDNCPSCDHWREYDFIGKTLGFRVYRCSSCGTVKYLEESKNES